MTTIAPLRRTYTEEDLLHAPEDGYSYELVDGELKRVPTQFAHDLVKSQLLSRLLPIAMLLGYVTTGEAGVRMRSGNVRVPDISFTRKERIREMVPRPGFGTAAPDLCVEIISESETQRDIDYKLLEYFESGAEQVWHLLPLTRQVRTFSSINTSVLLNEDDYLEGSDLIPGFRVRVGDLFDIGLE